MFAVEKNDRAQLNAGRFHVDKEKGDSFLLLGVLVGADKAEDHVGILTQGRPGLLSVYDIMVAGAYRRTFEAGEIRSGARLRKTLTPPIRSVEDPWKPIALLRLRTISDQHRTEHVKAKGDRPGGVRQGGLGIEDMPLDHALKND